MFPIFYYRFEDAQSYIECGGGGIRTREAGRALWPFTAPIQSTPIKFDGYKS